MQHGYLDIYVCAYILMAQIPVSLSQVFYMIVKTGYGAHKFAEIETNYLHLGYVSRPRWIPPNEQDTCMLSLHAWLGSFIDPYKAFDPKVYTAPKQYSGALSRMTQVSNRLKRK